MRRARNLVACGVSLGAAAVLLVLAPRRYTQPQRPQVVVTRALSDGRPCRVTIQPVWAEDGMAKRLTQMSVACNGREIEIPDTAFCDLHDVTVPEGIQVADFGEELYLLLSGGEGESAWQAKLTIRGSRVTDRNVTRGGTTIETAFFAAPTVTVATANVPLALETATSMQVSKTLPLAQSGGSL